MVEAARVELACNQLTFLPLIRRRVYASKMVPPDGFEPSMVFTQRIKSPFPSARLGTWGQNMAYPAGFEPATRSLAYHYDFRHHQSVCGLDYPSTMRIYSILLGHSHLVSTPFLADLARDCHQHYL